MRKSPIVIGAETLSCDAGWRNYHFLKLTTDSGVIGWSEYHEGFGSPGVTSIIQMLSSRVIGREVNNHERLFAELTAITRPALFGVIGEAIGAVENALLDAKAKSLGLPCFELLGGKIRDKARVYWSHCPTWRINHPEFFQPPVFDLAGVAATASEAKARGFSAIKTNIFEYTLGKPSAWRPGFAHPFLPERTITKRLLRDIRIHLETLREAAGNDMDILIDLNFNMRPDGYLQTIRELADLDLFWVELDCTDPTSMAYIRGNSSIAISSCETIMGLGHLLPYLEKRSVDVVIIDAIWNGAWQASKMAIAADAFETNVALHNFYGHLSTFINAHVAAAIPNLQIVETDIDRLPWDAELVTHIPEYHDGMLVIPDRPGWGCEPVEAAVRARPARAIGGLLQYKAGTTSPDSV